MKSVTYRPRLRLDPPLFAKTQIASELLDEVIGRSAGEISAEWDRVQERGQTEVALKLSNGTDEASSRIGLRDFEEPNQLGGRLYWLWSDLLGVEIRRRIDSLLKSNGEE